MPRAQLHIYGLPGIPEIHPGDDLGGILAAAIRSSDMRLQPGDVLVVAQKVVSKAEGSLVQLDSIEPSPDAVEWAREFQKDPRVVELVFRESRRIVRKQRGILIVETHHGFVCANAGVDVSNTPPGTATVLPRDPDGAARKIAASLLAVLNTTVAVIVSDTFGRPWREGLTNVAIGVAGIAPLIDYRGRRDAGDRVLQATVIAVADELASAAELVMGKTDRIPAALIQGFRFQGAAGSGRALIRAADLDLFR